MPILGSSGGSVGATGPAGSPGLGLGITPFLYVSGRYIQPGKTTLASSLTTYVPIGNRIHLLPFQITRTISVNELSAWIQTTAGAAGDLMRMGIYNADTNYYPSTVKVDGGSLSTSTTGAKQITISSTSLVAGLYWTALLVNSGSLATFRAFGTVGAPIDIAGIPTLAANPAWSTMLFYDIATGPSSALPSLSGVTAYNWTASDATPSSIPTLFMFMKVV